MDCTLHTWTRVFCCAFLLLISTAAFASDPPEYLSRTWQIDEGLPQNAVQAVAQSAEGYLWVGTTRGLARFDGVRFEVYDSENTRAFKNSSVTALCQRRDGSLWIGTGGGGVVVMDRGRFEHHAMADDAPANNVKCIVEGTGGRLWIGTAGGLFCVESNRSRRFTVKDGLAENIVRSVAEERNRLWIGTGSGVNLYDGTTIIRQTIPARNPNPSVRAIFCDSQGRVWVGIAGGLACLKDGKFKTFSKKDGLPDDNITVLSEDRRGTIWVGTFGGLCRFTNGKFVIEKNGSGGFYDQVNALLEDQEGDIWAGARDGLHKLRARRFLAYTRQQGLPHDNIMSVLEDRPGNLWVATWGGGLAQLKEGTSTTYSWENSLRKGLNTDLILSLYEDRDGSILIGTDYEGGTFRFNDGKFARVWDKEEASTNRIIRVIYRDRAGNLWFGASAGLVLGGSNERFLEGATIRCIAESKDGTLWLGSNDGLFRRNGGAFERSGLPAEMQHETIIALHADEEGSLWIGTEKHGLGRLKNGRYASYTTKQGLLSDEIFEILEDDHGWFWVSCSRGVFRISKANLAEYDQGKAPEIRAIAYGRADGMESIQCNGVSKPAGWKSRDGRLWFATTKGLVVVDPNMAEELNRKAPEVRIEEVLADGRSLGAFDSKERLVRVQPGRGELEFHYTALSFAVPEENQFRYKLTGVDSDWVNAGSRRVAYYNSLRPGNYEFRVLAANNDGVWNQTGARLEVRLEPHVWQLWWFSSCAATAMAGMIGVSVRYATRRRLHSRLQQLKHQHAVERERSRIARDMHDDLGSRLTEILLLNELAQKSSAKPEDLQAHLLKQSEVIQDVAGSLDAIVWAVSPANDSLDRLANYLYEQVERFLAMRSIRCRLDVPDELPDYSVSSEIRHNVFLTVQESLNNIIRHSGASEVWFRLRVTPGRLAISIEDNGRGFLSADPSSFGNGLQNMEKRMKNLGGAFQLVSSPGDGTSIRLEVRFEQTLSNENKL